jgi:hypothetical protein
MQLLSHLGRSGKRWLGSYQTSLIQFFMDEIIPHQVAYRQAETLTRPSPHGQCHISTEKVYRNKIRKKSEMRNQIPPVIISKLLITVAAPGCPKISDRSTEGLSTIDDHHLFHLLQVVNNWRDFPRSCLETWRPERG